MTRLLTYIVAAMAVLGGLWVVRRTIIRYQAEQTALRVLVQRADSTSRAWQVAYTQQQLRSRATDSVVTVLQSSAARADRRARVAQQRADSIAAAIAAQPVPDDTNATAWKWRYEQRTAEVAELRAAIHDDSVRDARRLEAIAKLTVDRDQWRATADSATAAIARLNQDVHATVTIKTCRIGPLPCPSRTISGIAGLAIGLLVH